MSSPADFRVRLQQRGQYNRFRYYDPNIGRYVSADPIGQDGGFNLYRYAANNPTGWIDPFGLDIAIVTGGPTGRNRAGHSAAAVEGRGTYSFGTREDFGSSFTDYLESQSEYRDQEVTIIETTPEEDAAFIAAFEAAASAGYDFLNNNCETAVNAGLDAAGVEGEGAPGSIPGISGERAKARSSKDNGGGSPTTVGIPEGSNPNTRAFNRFNP